MEPGYGEEDLVSLLLVLGARVGRYFRSPEALEVHAIVHRNDSVFVARRVLEHRLTGVPADREDFPGSVEYLCFQPPHQQSPYAVLDTDEVVKDFRSMSSHEVG